MRQIACYKQYTCTHNSGNYYTVHVHDLQILPFVDLPLTLKYTQRTIRVWRPRTHPVVGEVLIHDFSHLCLLTVQNLWGKVENDVEHAGLRGQSSAPVVRARVLRDLQNG